MSCGPPSLWNKTPGLLLIQLINLFTRWLPTIWNTLQLWRFSFIHNTFNKSFKTLSLARQSFCTLPVTINNHIHRCLGLNVV